MKGSNTSLDICFCIFVKVLGYVFKILKQERQRQRKERAKRLKWTTTLLIVKKNKRNYLSIGYFYELLLTTNGSQKSRPTSQKVLNSFGICFLQI